MSESESVKSSVSGNSSQNTIVSVRSSGNGSNEEQTVLDACDYDDDPTPFQTVIYKKSRKAGIPVILTPVNPKESFLNVNPDLYARDVMRATQERIRQDRISKEGALTITVASLAAAKSLLEVTCVANIAVTTRIPESYARNVGKITGVRTPYSDEQLLGFFKPSGAVSVRRQRAYRRDENGDTTSRPYDSVIVTFRSDIPMPEELSLGFNTYKVHEYFSPTQCFHCQKFGHLARNCKGSVRCKACAGPHAYRDCTTRNNRKCANCGGAHYANYGGCLKRKIAIDAVRTGAREGAPVKQNRSNPAMVTPTVPPPRAPKPPVKTQAAFPRLNEPVKPREQKPQRPPRRAKAQQAPPVTQPVPENPWQGQKTHTNPPSLSTQPSIPPLMNLGTTAAVNAAQLIAQFVPFLFTTLRALIAAIPGANSIREVKDMLAYEPLLISLLNQHHHGQ